MDGGGARERRGERGVAMVIAVFAATTLILFAALAIDVGLLWTSRTQSQSLADAAALAAAHRMLSESRTRVTTFAGRAGETTAVMAARAVADANPVVANPGGLRLADGDFAFGAWDFQAGTLVTPADPTAPDQITAARVTVRMDDSGERNTASPSFFARLMGIESFPLESTATAYLGCESTFPANDLELPIAINACRIAQNFLGVCGLDFCAQTGGVELDLDFLQNACWAGVDLGSESAVGDAIAVVGGDLGDILAFAADAQSVLDDLASRVAGGASWVVKLPVIGCASSHASLHCGPSVSQAPITGAICFEIEEFAPPLTIRGRFLCPDPNDDAMRAAFFRDCLEPSNDMNDTDLAGGCCYGYRADRAVLVE